MPKGTSLRSAKPPSDSSFEYRPTPQELGSVPTYFDWRQKNVVTSVKDQGWIFTKKYPFLVILLHKINAFRRLRFLLGIFIYRGH